MKQQISRRVIQIVGLLLLAIFILCMAYRLRSIFNPVLLSLLLAYILNPIPNFFERYHIGRTVTIFLIYLILATLSILASIFLVPVVASELIFFYEVTFVGDNFEDYAHQLVSLKVDRELENTLNQGQIPRKLQPLFKRRYLFRIPSQYAKALKIPLPEHLRAIFRKQRHPLSEDLLIEEKIPGTRWLLLDSTTQRHYEIVCAQDTLEVYENQKKYDAGLKFLVRKKNHHWIIVDKLSREKYSIVKSYPPNTSKLNFFRNGRITVWRTKNGRYDPDEPITRDLDMDGIYDRAYIDAALSWIREGIASWNQEHPKSLIEWDHIMERVKQSLRDNLDNIVKQLINFSGQAVSTLFKGLVGFFSVLSYVILLPLYTFFLLRGLNNIRDTLFEYIPPANKERTVEILKRIHKAVSSFFRGKVIICLVKGFLTWLVLHLMGIKFALIFGVIQAVASLIPFLVLLVGMVPNLILICLDITDPLPYLFATIFFYMIIECLEGFFLTPWVMGKETGLHPLTVILCLLIGGKLFGLFGLLLAVPTTTTLKILSQEIVLPHLREVIGYQNAQLSSASDQKKGKDV